MIKKYNLNPDSNLSLALQVKEVLLRKKTEDENIKVKIDKQKYLKLCLENWQSLKSNGYIMEEAKAIILGSKNIDEPRIEDKEELVEQKIDRNCGFCLHKHSDKSPHKCTDENCLCGIRG